MVDELLEFGDRVAWLDTVNVFVSDTRKRVALIVSSVSEKLCSGGVLELDMFGEFVSDRKAEPVRPGNVDDADEIT